MLRIFAVACLLALAFPAAAAKPVPPPVLEDAARAQVEAEAAGAADYAPMDLDFARDKLARANLALEKRDTRAAVRLAEQALVDAQLATAKSRAAKARAQIEARSSENAKLRSELGGEDGQ